MIMGKSVKPFWIVIHGLDHSLQPALSIGQLVGQTLLFTFHFCDKLLSLQ